MQYQLITSSYCQFTVPGIHQSFRFVVKNKQGIPVVFVRSHPTCFQWEFQDPKMEVLYHIRPYFLGVFPYIGLT